MKIYDSSLEAADQIDNMVGAKINSYILRVRQNRPIYYYISSRIRAALKLMIEGVKPTFTHNKYVSIIKTLNYIIFQLISTILYLVLIPIGLLIYIFFREEKLSIAVILSVSGFAVVFVHAGIQGLPQSRYIASAYPYIYWGVPTIIGFLIRILKEKGKF